MKKYLTKYALVLFVLSCTIQSTAWAQKTEIKISVFSGLYFFRGNGSSSNTNIYFDDVIGYYNPMPYGRKSSNSYAGEISLQKLTRNGHIYGLGVGFEKMQSKALVDSSFSDTGARPADGKVSMLNDYVVLFPHIGHRINWNAIKIDINAGVDFAFSTKVIEKVTPANYHPTKFERERYSPDIRPRAQLTAFYNKIGVTLGYSLGTTNFYHYNNSNYPNRKAYANFIRFGISYRLK